MGRTGHLGVPDVGQFHYHRFSFLKLITRPVSEEYDGRLFIDHVKFDLDRSLGGVYEIGLGMCIPTMLAYATEEQKQRYAGPALRGEEIWCQLFSEPAGGSDLAGLRTRADRDGDADDADWIINGQKIWTSGAHLANMMFAMVRTDPEAPKHRGISYLLLSMETPGITVRPLVQMSDARGFNEVFFEDVRVPAKNVVGEINRGWYVGATHLDFERSNIGRSIGHQRELEAFRRLILAEEAADSGKSTLGRPGSERLDLADRFVEASIAKTISQRVISMQARGELPNYEASMSKLFSSELNQRISRTATRLLGLYGALRSFEDDHTPVNGRWATLYLSTVSRTIAAGSSEIQRNVIATRGLGLPRG